MLVVRPAGEADIEALMDLAYLSGRGFTSLPEDRQVLSERLALSDASFAGAVTPQEAWYTLMIEDLATGTIAGVAGVRAAVGLQRPHFSFRVMTLAQYSSATKTRFDHQALVLVNECGGWTEVGSLFVRPEYRKSGAGGLLARARYLLIATDPGKFGETVMAELRGRFDAEDRSPFWEGVGYKFFRIPFEDADRMITSTDGQFILDLAPRHPIYAELIDPAASEAIGAVHQDGEAALALLEREGFTRSLLIDMFDGGPTVTCPRDTIATIRNAVPWTSKIGNVPEVAPMLVAPDSIAKFRAVRAPVVLGEGVARISEESAAALGIAAGETLLVGS
jgi:arginine N-succinyltransferase